MTHVFGLTGGVASGKTTVARRFAARGIPVIDADQLAREVVVVGSPALQEIEAELGPDLLDEHGALDRKRLGQRVWSDPSSRERLNRIVHPRVADRFLARVQALTARGEPLCCYDVPLLFERQLQDKLRPVVVVTAEPALQLGRLMARNGLRSEEALARIAAQLPLPEKVAQADYVIDNSGTLEQTELRADQVLDEIRRSLKLFQQ